MNQGTIIKVNTQPTNFQHLIQHSKTRIKEKKRATYSTLAQRHPQTYRHTHTRTHARYIHFLYWLFERVIESTKKKREQKSSLSLFLSSSLFVIPCFKDYSYFFFFFTTIFFLLKSIVQLDLSTYFHYTYFLLVFFIIINIYLSFNQLIFGSMHFENLSLVQPSKYIY